MTQLDNEISFKVVGLPPIKDGTNSVFGPDHDHAPRVRSLLDAAQQSLAEQPAFVPIEKEHDVMLRVVVRAPRNHLLSDATNYLGGIADVLEDKSRRGPLPHLGVLAGVWLYRSDTYACQRTCVSALAA